MDQGCAAEAPIACVEAEAGTRQQFFFFTFVLFGFGSGGWLHNASLDFSIENARDLSVPGWGFYELCFFVKSYFRMMRTDSQLSILLQLVQQFRVYT